MTARVVSVAVDAMGGDLGPGEVVRGVVQAARSNTRLSRLILVGDEPVLRAEISRHAGVPPSVEVHHASQTIEMDDKPREVYRRKPDASVVVAARLVKEGKADAFVSIGNTGAAMAAAVFLLRPIRGIGRPAIACPIPSTAGQVVLLDGGANVDCLPQQLLQFGIMGEAYARHVLGRPSPSVALLANGEEPGKGDELTRQAHKLLREHLPAFVGNVEGRDVFRGKADVVVCDGFTGNILLKTGEGVAEMIYSIIRAELTRYRWMRVFLLPLRRRIRELRHRIDYREFGGAPLLGVNGVCIVGHGRSDAVAIANAIRVAATSVEHELVRHIEHAIASHTAASS
ncbi:MAG TPA: phosphate acyltransferase PlsX [Chthonomonadales bacterium]|nr:phosphate acyltransferase PlsX [Chthonomonadales bacterium]